jgi:hypothetical protein
MNHMPPKLRQECAADPYYSVCAEQRGLRRADAVAGTTVAGDPADVSAGIDLPDALIAGIGDVEISKSVHRDGTRTAESRMSPHPIAAIELCSRLHLPTATGMVISMADVLRSVRNLRWVRYWIFGAVAGLQVTRMGFAAAGADAAHLLDGRRAATDVSLECSVAELVNFRQLTTCSELFITRQHIGNKFRL